MSEKRYERKVPSIAFFTLCCVVVVDITIMSFASDLHMPIF